MSRIHEALKRAEQERAASQSAPVVEAPIPAPQSSPEAVMAGATAMAGAVAPVRTGESPLASSRLTRWNPDPKTMLFFNGEEQGAGMEEFRTLRSRLYQIRDKQPLTRLLVTSALPKEGKSFTAANLAQIIVRQHGKRALLIDADLRNPQLHGMFGAEPGPGLSDYLKGEVDETGLIQRGPMENLFLIPAGTEIQNPAELIANGRMRALLDRLEPLVDWIIVDSAPAAIVSDTAVLAKYCDGILMVVRSNATPVEAARRARREFADRNVVGVVLNGIAPELSPYSQYYYSSYGNETNGAAKN